MYYNYKKKDILIYASNISNLQLYHNELQNERAEWEREKKFYIAIQNNMNYQLAPIRPMPSHRYNKHY